MSLIIKMIDNQIKKPETETETKTNKKWLLWGLIGFTAILVTTAVILFLQLKKPAPTPLPKPKASPVTPEIKEVIDEGVCELGFSIEELQCSDVLISPSNTDITTNETRTLEAQITGGSGTYYHSWSATSDGSDNGSLSSTIANPTVWTAPGILDNPQTWTITDIITDSSTNQQTTECSAVLSFGGLSVCFDSCESDLDCEADLRCMQVSSVDRCVNSDCPEETDCICPTPTPSPSVTPSPTPSATPTPSPTPSSTPITSVSPSSSPLAGQPQLPEAGVAAPAIIGVLAGVLLMILGLLF